MWPVCGPSLDMEWNRDSSVIVSRLRAALDRSSDAFLKELAVIDTLYYVRGTWVTTIQHFARIDIQT